MIRGLPRRPRRGFTLLEVIVALAILTFIGALSFSTIMGALQTRDILEAEDAVNQSARVAMDQIRRELSLAYLTPNTGAINTYRTLFVGQDGDPDRLWFTSLSHHRLYRDTRECDQTEVTLWTEEDPHNSDARVLLHREAPRIDEEPEKDGVILPIAYGVKDFQLRYLNGDMMEWKEEWDTGGADTPNTLPRAVQVILTLLAPDPEDEEKRVERNYVTTVMLTFGKPIPKNILDGG